MTMSGKYPSYTLALGHTERQPLLYAGMTHHGIIVTQEAAKARRFATYEEATACWRKLCDVVKVEWTLCPCNLAPDSGMVGLVREELRKDPLEGLL